MTLTDYMNKAAWIIKLREEIKSLQEVQKILLLKNPTYPFLYPLIENALYGLANILVYVENKNPYLTIFNEGYFKNRNITMHKTFFNDLHIGVEDGLRKIIEEKKFPIVLSRMNQANEIVDSLSKELKQDSAHKKIFTEIIELAGKRATFNDYLNGVLENIAGLEKRYVKECRIYFEGINIIRNKVSHSDMTLSESEKKRLIRAKLKNAISTDGKSIQMTFEGYKLLTYDVIRFFDNLYAHL